MAREVVAVLRSPKQPLDDLLAALDLPLDPNDEKLDDVGVPADTPVDPAKLQSSLQQILAVVEAYGTALKGACRFEHPSAEEDEELEWKRVAGATEWLRFHSGLTPSEIETFNRKNRKRVEVLLDLSIDKRTLAKDLLIGSGETVPSQARPALVFQQRALENLLAQRLADLEEWWDPQIPIKLVILAPEWKGGILDGRYLAVVGGDPATGWKRVTAELNIPPSSTAEKEQLSPEDFLKVRRDDLRWDDDWVRSLTPLHLEVKGEAPFNDSVVRALRLHLVNLCLLFTADRTTRQGDEPRNEDDDRWLVVYSGGGEKAVVSPAQPEDLDDSKAFQGAEALTRTLHWAYADKLRTDRLHYLQSAIARTLRPLDSSTKNEEYPCKDLLLRLQDRKVDERLEGDWKMFIEGRLEKFGAQVRALEEEVSKTVDTFSSQIGSMIKSLSDTMLGAVGVLLGAYIAALFKEDLKLEILAFSVSIYIFYLLGFPLGYNMSERLTSYWALLSQFQTRRQRFEHDLSPEQVSTIVGNQVLKSQNRFRRWFAAVVATYLMVAGALWLLVPSPIDAIAYEEDAKLQELAGALAPNKDLRTARLIGEGRLEGAEDIEVDAAGCLYTGTAEGRIVRITLQPNGREILETWAETGGRPLGLRFGLTEKTLFAADANKGLLAINEGGGVKVLATQGGGVPFGYTNDLDVAPDGTIYFSDASTRFGVADYLYDLLEARPRGRLLVYTPPPSPPAESAKGNKEQEEGKVRVLLDGLAFANGVALAHDGSFVLVAETFRYRIWRYWLTGEDAGRSEPFIKGLPGFPGNLSCDPATGRFWVAIYTLRNPNLSSLQPRPWLKNQLAKLPRFLWPKPRPYGLVLAIDTQGKVVEALHDPGGERVRAITSAEPYEGKLYLGSLHGPVAVWEEPTGRQRSQGETEKSGGRLRGATDVASSNP